MSLTLHVRLPSSKVLAVEVNGNDTVKVLKAKVASSAGLDVNLFLLIFDGSELGANEAECEKEVCQYPFQDQSELLVTIDKRYVASQKMKELGWEEPWGQSFVEEVRGALGDMEEGGAEELEECDARYAAALQVMYMTDMCEDRDSMNMVLAEAASEGLLRCVDILLEAGVSDVDAPIDAHEGATALHLAVEANHMDVAHTLLAHNADPNKQDSNGSTPMHVLDAVTQRMLLSFGGKTDMQTKDGNTPLHLAVIENDKTCVQVLLSHNADRTLLNSRGRTPLDCAKYFKHAELVSALDSN
eukprot:TRINITY_DN7521_c0_g1_i1.p1 TRINITY_DN7521_c0_g1~~TRINITY_DN7521_c0_g1_i1.p1  ORF type:complete len:300 (+),score=63.91 TRINITY_DN7521_c0_g1_i1:2343-3242(+)